MIRRALAVSLLMLAPAGCALLRPETSAPPRLFVLEAGPGPASVPSAAPTPLLLGAPSASPGFDTPRMIYVTRPYELQAFASHQWVDTPERMLAPLLLRSLEAGAGVAVGQGSARHGAKRRLDTQILRLQQEFTETPSRVRFELRAELSDADTGEVLATRSFEAVEDAPSEDPYGGVLAANQAVSRVLAELAAWVAGQLPAPGA